MAAYYITAIGASPLLPLSFKEFVDTLVPDVFQVLNHTHMVFGAVPFIESFQPSAGKALALITEPYQSFPDQVAMLSHEDAVLATRHTTGAVSPLEPFPVKVVF